MPRRQLEEDIYNAESEHDFAPEEDMARLLGAERLYGGGRSGRKSRARDVVEYWVIGEQTPRFLVC